MPSLPPKQIVGDYQLGQQLGKGGFGVVWEGRNVKTGDFVAIKSVSIHNVPADE